MKKLTVGMGIIFGVTMLYYAIVWLLYELFSYQVGSIGIFIGICLATIVAYSLLGYLVVLFSKNIQHGFIATLIGLMLYQVFLSFVMYLDLTDPDAWSGLTTVLIGIFCEPIVVILLIVSIVFLIRIRKGKTPKMIEAK